MTNSERWLSSAVAVLIVIIFILSYALYLKHKQIMALEKNRDQWSYRNQPLQTVIDFHAGQIAADLETRVRLPIIYAIDNLIKEKYMDNAEYAIDHLLEEARSKVSKE